MNRRIAIGATGVFLVRLASFAEGGVSYDRLVIPGKRIGRIRLGMDRYSVRQLLGKPHLINQEGSFIQIYWNIGNPRDQEYIGVIFRKDKAIQIETNSSQYVTSQGISAQSNLGQIRKKLGRLKVISFGLNDSDPEVAEHASHYWDDVKRGIAFELDLGYRPDLSSDQIPHALYVYLAGHRFIPPIDGKELSIK